MANNPKWCKSVTQWKKSIAQWVGSFDPEDTRALTIFLDFRPVWGNQALADLLWEEVFRVFNQAEVTSHLLPHDDLQREKPVGLLGHIRTEKSGIHKDAFNLKTNGLAHLVNGMRIYAVNHRIQITKKKFSSTMPGMMNVFRILKGWEKKNQVGIRYQPRYHTTVYRCSGDLFFRLQAAFQR